MKTLNCLIALVFLALPVESMAKPHTLSWSWPTTDCAGDPLDQAGWMSAEIIYDTDPMPMPSDDSGCLANDPDGPVGSVSVMLASPVPTEYTLNLQPGRTYYARIRVCYYLATNCSAWSNEKEFTVPYGKPQRSVFQ